ncbi:MAG: tripartite tricarboxylate transporter substrate binding protein [Burkholderiaceae bacterium]
MRRRRVLTLPLAFAIARPVAAQPQPGVTGSWPSRPVRWIVSQPAGAGPDILARYLAERVSKTWAQPVVVDNRPGGQNVIGAQAAARSAPDGYTLFYATTAAIVTNALTFKSLPYDAEKDFAPIRLIGRSPFVIAAGAGLDAGTLADVLAKARAAPGSMAIATEGPKTFSGMLAESVASLAGVKWNHVAYTKAADAIQDVVGGRVPLISLPEAALLASIRAGLLRPLAVSSAERLPGMAQVPALAETFAGYEYTGWNGLFAPAGTSAEVIAKINRDIEALVGDAEAAERFASLGTLVERRMTVAGFEAFLKEERRRWADVVKRIGIVPE